MKSNALGRGVVEKAVITGASAGGSSHVECHHHIITSLRPNTFPASHRHHVSQEGYAAILNRQLEAVRTNSNHRCRFPPRLCRFRRHPAGPPGQ